MFRFFSFSIQEKGIPLISGVKEKFVEETGKAEDLVGHYTQELIRFIPSLIWALIVLLVGLWVIKRMVKIAEKTMMKKELEVSLSTFLKSLLSIGLKIVLIVTVAGMIGIGTTSFVTILGAAGLAIGLALQGSLSNFAGGVLILMFKPFKVGDTIEAQGMSGEVKEIQIFNTILLTGEHKTVILPNGPLSNGAIVNITRHGNIRSDIFIRISNENDVEKVKNIIFEVLQSNSKVLKQPAPMVYTAGVNDGSINFVVRPYSIPSEAPQLQSELYLELNTALEKNKVKMPPRLQVIQSA